MNVIMSGGPHHKTDVDSLTRQFHVSARMSEDSDSDFEFGPQSPPLTAQIASVLRRYPDGGQILKELIQNADDAGATEIRFLLDPRSHSQEDLLDEELRRYQGPALYAWNNATFEKEDWKCLAKIEQSSKEKEVLKVGRFGLGFLSVFHITDLPVVISTKYVGIADPHRRLKFIRESHETISAGRKEKLSTFLKCKGHGSCFEGVFGVTSDTSNYHGTLFRFHLRQPNSESRITQNCYTPEKVRDNLFHSLKVEAPILLLFLKSILKVGIYEWDESCNKPVCKFSVQISKSMKRDRKICYNLAEGYNKSCSKATVILSSATTECSECRQQPTQYHWLIVNSIGSDVEELRELAEQMNILPWVGIAAPSPISFSLQCQDVKIDHISEAQGINIAFSSLSQQLPQPTSLVQSGDIAYSSGQAFCFLPLPGSIALPINVHGYFAVADNRRSIKWPSHDEKSKEAQWNEMLLKKLISPLYTLLLACRSSLIQYHGTSIGDYPHDAYAVWPVHAEVKNKHIWSEILEPILAQIMNLPILWTEADGGMWVKPTEAYFVHPEDACPQVAVRVLVEYGCKVVCLPSEIYATLITSEKMKEVMSTRYVTAELVQNFLRGEKSLPDFISRDEVYELLDYVLTYTPNAAVLEDIQLVPLNDYATCNHFAPSNGYNAVYIFPEQFKDALEFLPGISSVVIDTRVPFQLQGKLEDIAQEEALQIRLATPEIICGILLKQSIECWHSTQEQPCIWQPGKHNHPPVEWVDKVWSWIVTNRISPCKLPHVPIVPQERMHSDIEQVHLFPLDTSPGLCTLPDRLPHKCSRKTMLKIVVALGFVHVQKSLCVFQCPGIEQYIHCFNGRFLVLHLMKTGNASSFVMKLSNKEKDALCHFIAHDFGEEMSDEESACIKSLPIFKAGVGAAPTQYVCLNTSHYVLPPQGITFKKDIYYPPEILNDENSHDISSLLAVLKVKRVKSIDEFCETVILPFATKNDDLIMWVLQLPLANPKFLQQFSIIEPCVDPTKRKCPTELFDPEDEVFDSFFEFGSDNVFPAAKYKSVLPVLRAAGMKTWHALRSNSKETLSFLVDRAKSVSKLGKSKGFLRSKCVLSHLLNLKLLQNVQISHIKFLFSETDSPSNYPSQLTWYGSSVSQEVSPQEVCCRALDAYLVGSVLPVLSSDYGIHEEVVGFYEISVKDVVNHLRKVISLTRDGKVSTQSDAEKVSNIVMRVYDFLTSAKLSNKLELPIKWIWWKNSKTFLAPEDCIVRLPPEIVSLEPFVFCLPTNTEICSHVLAISPVKFQHNLSTSKAIDVLKKMKCQEGKALSPQEIRMAISILEWLKNQGHHTHDDILIPTKDNTLAKASECTFDDRNWTRRRKVLPQISRCTFVHDSVPPALAKHFCVTPLSHRVAPSEKVKLKYIKAGPHEPVTRRIRKIVEDYATSSDIFKELLQNADDAGATEVKFLIDWRRHPKSSLFADELKVWQGPALLAYNNSVFSDQDFQHICELAAETKMKDPYKTGRFGVGFCATYHITDLPSFISRHYFTVFDPHTTYLGERVSAGEPGMRIDLIESQEDLKVYADQFQPYNGMFGCDVFRLPKEGFQGTLFRFPFRCPDTARRSEICKKIVDKKSVENLLQCFKKEAPHLLLFLKHVRKVSLSVLEEKARSPSEIVDVQKYCECAMCGRMGLIDSYMKNLSEKNTVTSECHCTIATQLNIPRSSKKSLTTSKWIISSAVDLSCPTNDSNKERGLVPFAEVAIEVEETQYCSLFPKLIKGGVFCFLPLPQRTGLSFHVNGFFDVSQDRSGLKSTDDDRFGKEWNEFVCKGALTHAFIMGVSHLAVELSIDKLPSDKEKKKYLDTYYSVLDLAEGRGLIGEALSTSVKKNLAESKCGLIWSDVSGGKWLFPEDVVLLQLEYPAKHMFSTTTQVLLLFQHNICVIPNHVTKLIIDLLKGARNQIYTYHTFCRDVLMPNLSSTPCDLRDQHILFLLKNLDHFEWINAMMQEQPCIPVQCSDSLKRPKDVIDNRKQLLRHLYEPEEGYFPAEILQKPPAIMNNLEQLGMVSVLSVENIKERAQSVSSITDQCKAVERAWRILQYIQQNYYSVPTYYHRTAVQKASQKELRDALMTVPFLPTVQKPSNLEVLWYHSGMFVCPEHICVPKCNNLVFTQQPVVELPDESHLHPGALSLIGVSQSPPLSVVISHLLCVSGGAGCFDEDTEHFISDVMKTVYKYLQQTLCSSRKCETLQTSVVEAQTRLENKNFIWQNSHFLKVNQVFVHWKSDCYPYLCELSPQNKEYESLFTLLGVKSEPSVDVLANILCRIAEDYTSEKKVPENILTFVEAIVKKLFAILRVHKDAHLPSNMFLPDENSMMRPVQQLACDKVSDTWIQSLETFKSQFDDGEFFFVHGSIPRERAIKLGVRPLLDALLRNIEDRDFLSGTGYGQHEDLCDRLESILRKYPTNCSILNEFIQNADDAQASEIVFVLDQRKHSTKKIFSLTENWKTLQETPALCILNNRKFEEEDIKGIAQLGRGNKKDSPEMIGKFGIGFNVAYHITECPSFVSFNERGQPENYCVFDPTRSFAPGATKENPGRRWRIFEKPSVATDFPEQFAPYLLNDLASLSECAPNSVQNVTEKGYVVFRLPLTRQYTSTGSSGRGKKRCSLNVPKRFNSYDVHELLMEMKNCAGDSLLFLHHIRKMSAFEITEDGKCHLCFSTQNSLSSQDAEKCREFSEKMRNVALNEQNDFSAAYKAQISQVVTTSNQEGSVEEKTVEWLVHQQYRTQGIDQKLLEDAHTCSFRPLGGIAAPVGQLERQHLVFCFLPLPLKSDNPVHINGHFLVDDSRKHLENVPDLRPEKWNESLAEHVIAPCYVDLLLNAQEMTERCETDHKWFYSLFPRMGVEGEVGDLKLAEAVYKILLNINPRILLQIQHGPCDTDVEKVWFHLRGHEMGYFFHNYISEETEKLLSADHELEMALINLGMPITTEAPVRLYRGLSDADQTYTKEARVDPKKIVMHLKQVNISMLQATLGNRTALQLLLKFLIEGLNVCNLLHAVKTLPLLLSANGCLRKGPTIYHSAHISLLPHCSAHFVDQELEVSSVGQILSREDYRVIIPLEVEFLANHITLEDTEEAHDINELSIESLRLIEGLWRYLSEVEVSPPKLTKCFPCKALIPTEDEQLFPLFLANVVLCNEGGNMHIRRALKKLGYSTLSLKKLNPAMQQIFSHVVNNCSGGNDLIECFCTKPPSVCDATLNHEEVRAIIESVRVYKLTRVGSMLVKLRLFETLEGTFTAVDEKCKIYVTSMSHRMPLDSIKELQDRTGYIILKVSDNFIVKFYRKVLPDSTVYVNLPQLYKEFIIPNMPMLSTEALTQHLGYIRDARYHMRDRDLMLELKRCPFIQVKKKMFVPSKVYNPKSDFINFLRLFCEDRLLPIPWSQDEWLPFLKELGLRQKISPKQWLKRAEQFIEDACQDSISTFHYKSNTLLEALCKLIQDQMTNKGFDKTLMEFLEEVSELEFIYNPCIQRLEVLVNAIFRHNKPQGLQRNLFCFKHSVMSGDSELAALCSNILPEICNETLKESPAVRNALQVECPVQTSTIVQNLEVMSEKYTPFQNLSVSEEIGEETSAVEELTQIMSAHFAALDKKRNLRVHIDTESLRDTLCIVAGGFKSQGCFVLIKPSQLVLSLPSDIHLEPFCYPVPDNLRPYKNILAALGVPNRLSARKCAEVLEIIYKQLEESDCSLSKVDEYKRVALGAYKHLVCTQREQGEELPDELYLPSEDDDIYLNEHLLHNNANWYAQRLQGENYHFLKLPPPDANGERDPPASLGVRMLTDVVSEELHEDMWSSDFVCTDEELYARKTSRKRCHYVLKIHNTLTSPHLQNGLLRVYFDEHKVKPPPEFEEAAKMLKDIKIRCVLSKAIVTQLHKDGRVIHGTDHHKYCHVSLEGEEAVIWIAPHGPFVPIELLQSLSSGIKMLLHNHIKNEALIMTMFDCEPREIKQRLDQKQVAFYDPNVLKETKYHEIGEAVPPESITSNDRLIILNYEIGEMVRYQDSSGCFMLAEVTQVNSAHLSSLEERAITLRIRALNSDPEEQDSEDSNEFISVSPLCVYKILTPSQKMFLFKDQSHPSPDFTLATAVPICLVEVPSTERELYEWLDSICKSRLLAELPEAVVTMIFKRLYVHLDYVLKQGGESELLSSAVQYLQHLQELNSYSEIPYDSSDSPSLEDIADSPQQTPSDFSDRQFVTLGNFTATLPQAQQGSTASSAGAYMSTAPLLPQHAHAITSSQSQQTGSSTSAHLSTPSVPLPQQAQAIASSRPQHHPQLQSQQVGFSRGVHLSAPLVPLPQQTQAVPSSRPQYIPRLQPQQRRGYQPPRRNRFQPEVPYDQPWAPPPPPVSEKDAQIWFDQARADYRAAEFLMGQITLTPMVETLPIEYSDESSEEGEDKGWEEATEAQSICLHYMERDDEGLKGTQVEETDSSIPIPLEGDLQTEEGSEVEGEMSDEEVRSKVDRNSGHSVPQFPALVCFLCHETVEKCIKGVSYAYCGLKSNLVNSSALVSLLDALKASDHRPQHLFRPIEECVLKINEHENKSRLPNFQIPPCAPATVYTAFNANETFLAVRTLLQHLQCDTRLKTLLGDLGELPKPKFTSSLKAMAGSNAVYPPFWDPHDDDNDDMRLVLLDEGEEYESVAARFYQTMPNANITRIERIQNRVLWRKYISKSREMWQSGDGVLNEELLFHGSRTNNPKEIYGGDASFDMRLSNDGMWGKGNYFAVNASYSDRYAFHTRITVMPCKKMLAAWVLIGHSYHSQPHRFVHPPPREGTQGGVQRRYDSVNGTTGGSKVYITYDNTLAYPAYLITYTN